MTHIKGKRRVIAKRYFNDNTLYLLQVYERNFFKRWLNIGVTTDKAFATEWQLLEHGLAKPQPKPTIHGLLNVDGKCVPFTM